MHMTLVALPTEIKMKIKNENTKIAEKWLADA